MPKINVLPKSVYQLIAAGEVVERPSSVIKEMIENSVDAGAKNITVEIKNGGSTYMRITDDGCGIEKDDVKKVFVSHATSKIKESSDLDAIGTLGFRGEAMASISAVAQVELLSRVNSNQNGIRYVIAAGEEKEFDDAGCPVGTTIVVRNLFFNTPARMKFLKKDVTEGNSVAAVVEAVAISHPEISFRFIRDGKQVLITSGNSDLKSAVYSVLGKEVSQTLIGVDYKYNSMEITGFVSKPSASRKSRSLQYFFINGRMVKSKTAMAALEQAYKNSIMVGRYPACVLNIKMDNSLVDVNVHPSKIEVRFVNEKPVFDLVYYGVKTAITSEDTVKEVHLKDSSDLFENQKSKDAFSTSGKIDFFKKQPSPVQTVLKQNSTQDFWQVKSAKSFYDTESDEDTQSLDMKSFDSNIDIDIDEKPNDNEALPTVQVVDEGTITSFKLIGEAFSTFIIIEIKNDLYFIDKHAAHERMNFEKLKSGTEINTQLLLSPTAVKLTKKEFSVISDNFDLLEKSGFEAEEFGTDTVIVRGIPSMLENADITDLICEIAEKLLNSKTDIESEKMDWIFHSTACRSAVKAGDKTTPQEMELFVTKLLAMPDIRYCPHGRPVMIKMSRYEIEKLFGRIQ